MYVIGHGIAQDVIDNARAAVIEYFGQPLETKTRDRITRDNYRGYIPLGFFSPNVGGGASDQYEGYKLHCEIAADDPVCEECELYGPNKWPQRPALFRERLQQYWQECDQVAAVLLEAFAAILGTPPRRLLQAFDKPLTNMTLLHYPPKSPDGDGVGIHPHKDTDALTILAHDPVGGLMVRPRNADEWIHADSPKDALTVNIGDLMELWSGGYFVSTPHKVVNTSGAERYSFPYFAVPRYDTIVAPLRSPEAGFDRNPIHVADASREVWRTNWPDTTPDSARLDILTLES